MKKRFVLSVLSFAALASTTAAAEDLPAWFFERKIIGNNDLEPIEATAGTDAYDKARIVARVETVDGSGFCTASRVAEDLFLTNYHCWEFKPCESIQFHMGYERDLPGEQQQYFKCVEVLSKLESLDYALYRVEKVVPPSGTSKVYNFENIGLAIPDNDTNGVTQDFEVDLAESVRNIRVTLKVKHPYVGDLQVKLKSPEGTEVTLHDRTGGGQDDLNLTLTGSTALSALIGQNALGTWTLEARDFARGDEGSVEALSIEIFYDDKEAITEDDTRGTEFPVATLWAGKIEVNQPLLVASHPAARLKEIDRSETCVLRTIETEVVSERQTITHTCDTEGGSSGSPVLDRATGHVVALHWGGTTEYNLSIPMKLVVEHLQQNVAADHFSKLSIQR